MRTSWSWRHRPREKSSPCSPIKMSVQNKACLPFSDKGALRFKPYTSDTRRYPNDCNGESNSVFIFSNSFPHERAFVEKEVHAHAQLIGKCPHRLGHSKHEFISPLHSSWYLLDAEVSKLPETIFFKAHWSLRISASPKVHNFRFGPTVRFLYYILSWNF